MDLSHIAACSDLTEDDFALASASRETAYELLNHASVICEPHTGEERVLLFLARCALQDWIDGDLRIEVRLEGMYECHLVLLCGLGGDAYEVMKRVHLSASFLSFKQLAEQPDELDPLRATTIDNQRIVLDSAEVARKNSAPPPEFAEAQRRLETKLASYLAPGRLDPAGDREPDAGDADAGGVPLPLVQPSATSQALARVKLATRRIGRLDISEVSAATVVSDDGRYRAVQGEAEAAPDEPGVDEQPPASSRQSQPDSSE